jgi:hypothetical protein
MPPMQDEDKWEVEYILDLRLADQAARHKQGDSLMRVVGSSKALHEKAVRTIQNATRIQFEVEGDATIQLFARNASWCACHMSAKDCITCDRGTHAGLMMHLRQKTCTSWP